MFKKKEMELNHEMEMEKLEYIRETEFLILEKQWELAHRQMPQYYPQIPEQTSQPEVPTKTPSEKKYGRKKK